MKTLKSFTGKEIEKSNNIKGGRGIETEQIVDIIPNVFVVIEL